MTHPVGVPSDLDSLTRLHGGLVRSTILKTCKRYGCHPEIEEQEDLLQHVYLKMLERDFLARCRQYQEANPSKRFQISLVTFINNLVLNFLRDMRVRHKHFPFNVEDDDLQRKTGVVTRGMVELPEDTVPSHESSILAKQYLGEIAGFLMDEPEIRAIIEAALKAGGTLNTSDLHVEIDGWTMHESTVRRYIRRLKARAREVAA